MGMLLARALLRLLLGRPESFHSSNATPRLPDRNVRFAAVRFHLSPVRFRLAAARFHLRPVSSELSGISLPLAGVRVRLPPARARVPTVRRPLAGVRGRLPPARASVPTVSRPLLAMRGLHPAYDGTGHDHEPTALERAGAPPDEVSSSLDERRVVPGKRPFAHEFSSSREDKIEPERPRSTARRTGPIIAQGVAGRETSM